MSRTKKDRPNWVISNDTTFERRQERHNHVRFGKEVWYSCYILDDNGDKVVETHIELDHMWDEEFNDWVEFKTVRYTYPRESYLSHVVADHCTIDEPLTDVYRYYHDKNPCAYVVYDTKINRPRRDEKRTYHSGKRSAEKAPLRAAAKLFNSHEDIDDYDNIATGDRTKMHYGWWN